MVQHLNLKKHFLSDLLLDNKVNINAALFDQNIIQTFISNCVIIIMMMSFMCTKCWCIHNIILTIEMLISEYA